MGTRVALLAVLALAMPARVGAYDIEAITLAGELGTLLGSEEACGLEYDQAAIQRYIDEKLPPDAMGFASLLQMNVEYKVAEIEGQTQSTRTAHCRSVENTARHFGFIQ